MIPELEPECNFPERTETVIHMAMIPELELEL